METVFFIIVAAVAVAAAAAVILSENTVHSGLFLVVNLFCIALLYLSLGAEFLAAAQILVYAGAIMVLFLFVITLLNPGREENPERLTNQRAIGVGLGLLLLVEITLIIRTGVTTAPVAQTQRFAEVGNVQAIGFLLFTDYLLPLQVLSVVLLVAVVGAVILAKRRVL